VVIRTREYLAAMAAREEGLVLLLLRFADELRPIKEFDLPKSSPSEYRVTDREIELAKQLVDAQTVEWKPEQYEDTYHDRLMDWIEKKAEAGDMAQLEPQDQPEGETASNVIDLVDLLRQSVQATGKKVAEKKEPAKKSRSKKKPA
jgi:DNA end-binding protein Ku